MKNMILGNLVKIKSIFKFLIDNGYAFRVLNAYEVCFIHNNKNFIMSTERYSSKIQIDINFGEDLVNRHEYSMDL